MERGYEVYTLDQFIFIDKEIKLDLFICFWTGLSMKNFGTFSSSLVFLSIQQFCELKPNVAGVVQLVHMLQKWLKFDPPHTYRYT